MALDSNNTGEKVWSEIHNTWRFYYVVNNTERNI